jgi:molybdopterin-guanine dinucleotide biosynthesis protein A
LTDSAGLTGLVLCGGSGRRFGGRDKPLELLDGRPIVEHVLDRVSGQVDSIVVSANRNLNRYAGYGHPVVVDRVADRGPLGGIEAALDQVQTELLFVCPGDAPLLPENLVGRLRSTLRDEDVAVPHDGERPQHLFMLLRRETASTIGSYLDQGGRSVAGWLEGLEVALSPFPDDDAFTNVNTAADLAALRSRRRSGAG